MRRSQEIPWLSDKRAGDDEQGRAPPATVPPYVFHEGASWSAFRPTFPPFVPQPPVSGADHPQLYQDIQRGLSIDFYGESNPLLVASWATFFRDQYRRVIGQAQEGKESSAVPNTQNYYRQQQQGQQEVDWRRDVDSFLKDVVASKVFFSPHMEHVFRQMPFSEDKAFFTAAYQVIFQEVRAAFDSPNLQEYLRCDDSLQEMIKHARIAHLNQYYGPKICRIVEEFLDRSLSEAGDRVFQAALLLSACENAMNTPVAYGKIKSLYAMIIASGNWQGGAEHSAEEQGDIYSHLEGKTVRHFFTLEEEAFILAVTDHHLQQYKTGSNSKRATTYLLWDESHSRDICSLLAYHETKREIGARSATFFHFPKRPNIFALQSSSISPVKLTMCEMTYDKPDAAVRASPSREAEESMSHLSPKQLNAAAVGASPSQEPATSMSCPSPNELDATAVRASPSGEPTESIRSPASSNKPDATAVRASPSRDPEEGISSSSSNKQDATAVRASPLRKPEESISSPSSNTRALRRSKRAKKAC